MYKLYIYIYIYIWNRVKSFLKNAVKENTNGSIALPNNEDPFLNQTWKTSLPMIRRVFHVWFRNGFYFDLLSHRGHWRRVWPLPFIVRKSYAPVCIFFYGVFQKLFTLFHVTTFWRRAVTILCLYIYNILYTWGERENKLLSLTNATSETRSFAQFVHVKGVAVVPTLNYGNKMNTLIPRVLCL